MPFRRGRSFRGSQRSTRQTEWASAISAGEANIAASGTKLVMGSFTAAALAALGPSTFVRVRGSFSHRSDQSAADETYAGAFGIAVVNEDARVAGVASLPGPISNVSDDIWLYWVPFVGRFEFVGTAASALMHYTHIIVDGKAQRKIKDGDAIVFVAETAAFGSGVSLAFFLRVLFKTN